MAITAALVKELRERTGAGMMDCKKALTAADGDMEAAIEAMRKSGAAKADKKAGRIAAEGLVAIATSDDNKTVAILEVNSETDFVAKDDGFKGFVNDVCATVLSSGVTDVAELGGTAMASGSTVEEVREALVAKIGENIQVRRAEIIKTDGVLGSYQHGSRIGVVTELNGGDEALGRDVSMHVAASRPICVDETGVSPELLEKEKEIFTAQALESGKPPEIVEKMIGGRMKKYLKEITLLGQPFVKDPDQSVEQLLKSNSATVVRFVRFEVGEGIEKKKEDFAEEVKAQMNAS